MAEWWPVVVVVVVGVLLLVGVAALVARPVRRFTRERASLGDDVRTGVTQLRAIAYERRERHPHGVDSP
jgi:hypothetical protein